MKLSEAEAAFVDAVARDFRYLTEKHGFAKNDPKWDGRGISLVHHHDRLDVSNYLEADEQYITLLFPLSEGLRRPIVDSADDETFAYFTMADLPGESLTSERTALASVVDLENEVARRADVLSRHVTHLLSAEDYAGAVRDRVRLKQLSALIPQWRDFVQLVETGFGDGIAQYVAGVNTRGQIASFLKWPGALPAPLAKQLEAADRKFDATTVPVSFDARGAMHLPHPRARRWWRMPEKPMGRLRDYLFRPERGAPS